MTEIKITYDELVKRGARAIDACPAKLADNPRQHVFAEYTAVDENGAALDEKHVLECETDEDLVTASKAAPPARFLLGDASILAR